MANKDKRKEMEQLLVDAGFADLAIIVDDLSDDLQKVVLGAISNEVTSTAKTRALNTTTARVREADVEIRNWITDGVATSYIAGVNDTDEQLSTFGISTKAGKVNLETLKGLDELKPHLEATNILVAEAYSDFANGLNGVVRGAERALNDATRRQVRAKIAEGRLTGASIAEITKEVEQIVGQQGFTVLIDRGGKQWSLKTYSEMLARTHLIKANNEAVINRASEFDIDIVEVSAHGSLDALCAPQEGKIYSISGKSPNFPKLEVQPPYHPNCKHRLLLRPDLS